MSEPLHSAVLRDWIGDAVGQLTAVRTEINDLNVFPVPDSDTGSNLLATVTGAAAAADEVAVDADPRVVLRAIAEGAHAAARGNSGVIMSQFLVGLADAADLLDGDALTFNALWVQGLRLGAKAATRAVAEPAHGTMLTILTGAAAAAAATAAASPADLARAIADRCADDLETTTEQLPALQSADVVDAGSRGLLAVFDALVVAVTGTCPQRQQYRGALDSGADIMAGMAHDCAGGDDPGEMAFEVMYRLGGADAAVVGDLRAALNAIGDAVVVVGDGGTGAAGETFAVHVHTNDPGAAVTLGLTRGELTAVRISCFLLDAVRRGDTTAVLPPARKRAIVAVAFGDAAAELFAAEGATVVRGEGADGTGVSSAELVHAVREIDSAHTIVLANGALESAELIAVASQARAEGRAVVVLPAGAMPQGLAALAVHDNYLQPDDDAYAMAIAAANTRVGILARAGAPALTMAGQCKVGDILGSVAGEVLVIEPSLIDAAIELLDLLLATGGELVTAIAGADVPEAVRAALAVHVKEVYPGVEFAGYAGGQSGDLLQLGVE